MNDFYNDLNKGTSDSDGELFEESTENNITKYLRRIIEHLLKIAFATNNGGYHDWLVSVRNAQNGLSNLCKASVLSKIDVYQVLSDAYKHEKKDILNQRDRNSALSTLTQFIPHDCPWTFDDLLHKSTDKLLLRIYRSPEQLDYTYMQALSCICELNWTEGEDPDFVRRFYGWCQDCEYRSECVHKLMNKLKKRG